MSWRYDNYLLEHIANVQSGNKSVRLTLRFLTICILSLEFN